MVVSQQWPDLPLGEREQCWMLAQLVEQAAEAQIGEAHEPCRAGTRGRSSEPR